MICGVRAVRRRYGTISLVVDYLLAFCESIILKLLFAFVSHECRKYVALNLWFRMTRIVSVLVYIMQRQKKQHIL